MRFAKLISLTSGLLLASSAFAGLTGLTVQIDYNIGNVAGTATAVVGANQEFLIVGEPTQGPGFFDLAIDLTDDTIVMFANRGTTFGPGLPYMADDFVTFTFTGDPSLAIAGISVLVNGSGNSYTSALVTAPNVVTLDQEQTAQSWGGPGSPKIWQLQIGSPNSMEPTAAAGDIYPGDVVAVAMEAATEGVFAIDSTLTVSDAAVLQPASGTYGSLFPVGGRLEIPGLLSADKWQGALSLSGAVGPLSGSGLFASVEFTALTPGTVTLSTASAFADVNGQIITSTDGTLTLVVNSFTSLTGTALLQGATDHGTVELSFTDAPETALASSSGSFTILARAGARTLVADAPGYLPNQLAVNVVSGTLDVGSTTLRGGDTNDDNVIDIADLTQLGGSFRLSSGDPGFSPAADVNNDGVVNVSDLAILGSNFGLTGPLAW